MSILDKLRQKKVELENTLQKAKEDNEIRKAEKYKKRKENQKKHTPGTISYGLNNRQPIKEFIRDCKEKWDKKLQVKK